MAQFKSFVSESEIDDRRKKRQVEWDKVRKADDPIEAPEEEYDPKSLYDRLKEQKDKKQAEYEEAHKLKNMIRGLDDDEVEFLDFVDRAKEEIEVQRWKEEVKEIQEFRKAVATLAEKSADQRLQELKKEANIQLVSSPVVKKSQTSLLAKVVKRKSSDQKETADKKPKLENTGDDEKSGQLESVNDGEGSPDLDSTTASSARSEESTLPSVGILPGLSMYSDSSDSENSSSSALDHVEHFDLVGRPRANRPTDD